MRTTNYALKLFALISSACGCTNDSAKTLPLWPDGAPGSEQRRFEPERTGNWWVSNIHQPTLTMLLPPKYRASGAAVVILPGGGHEQLVFGPEGLQPARFFNRLGVAAFVLKYRLAKEEGSNYDVMTHARADTMRAIRLVRAKALSLGLDPNRIGIMGWSAGAELANLVTYGSDSMDTMAIDLIDRVSCHPDFQILVYPSLEGIPSELSKPVPPLFAVAANDDPIATDALLRLAALYHRAQAPWEMHLYARGGHGFNMGTRSQQAGLSSWPERLKDWLQNEGYLTAGGGIKR